MGKIFKIAVSAVMMFSALVIMSVPAMAGEAAKVYLELTSSTATLWPTLQDRFDTTDYLRGRVLFLDSNNEIATTFGGQDITDSVLVLDTTFGSKVRFSTQPATDDTLDESDWLAAGSQQVSIAQSWQEFAVNFDNVRTVGAGTITATLKLGNTTVSAQADITLEPPLANCYVVRTGGVNPLPDVLDELPPRKNNFGTVLTIGESVIVDVFSAFYNSTSDSYYFTDNIPSGAEQISISLDSSIATLEDGHVRSEVAKSSLSAPDDFSGHYEFFKDGSSTTVSASPASPFTRWIGDRAGDVTEDEYINVLLSDGFNNVGSTDFTSDTVTYKPKKLHKINIIGIPVNKVGCDGSHKITGFASNDADTSWNPDISAIDILKLVEDYTETPQGRKWKVPGKDNQTCIFGAIVGYADNEKLAAFAQGLTATFYLAKRGQVPVNSDRSELRSLTPYSPATAISSLGKITTTAAYQAILPFAITACYATAQSDGTYVPSITDLYIDRVELSDGSALDSDYYDNNDSVSKGIDFIAQDAVGCVTLTDLASLNEETAGGDGAEIEVAGRVRSYLSSNQIGERSFTARVFKRDSKGNTCSVGLENTFEAISPLIIPNDEDNIAKQDITIFSALLGDDGQKLLFYFTGDQNDTNFIEIYKDPSDPTKGLKIDAADPDDVDPNNISVEFSIVNSMIDEAEDHDTVLLNPDDEIVKVKDVFSNSYGQTGATLEDSDLSGGLYLPDESGAASSTDFPGASVKISENDVLLRFDTSTVSEGQDQAILQLVSPQGNASKEVTVNLRAVQQVVLDPPFISVPGVTDTPVSLFLTDQNGDFIKPLTITAANAPSGNGDASDGNAVEVELEVLDGSVLGVGTTQDLTTVSTPIKTFSAEQDEGKDTMTIIAETKKYSSDILELKFVPDFEPPYIEDIIITNCTVQFVIADTIEVDTENSDATFFNSAGDNITAILNRVSTDNGTTGSLIYTGFPDRDDTYTAILEIRDAASNTVQETRVITVPCIQEEPSCLSVNPTFGITGQQETVTITGDNTNFIQDETQVSFDCDGDTDVVIQTITVNTPTELEVSIEIGGTAPPATSSLNIDVPSMADENSPTSTTTTTPTTTTTTSGKLCDVTVETGEETILCDASFEIVDDITEPLCINISPSEIKAGQTVDITITGDNTSFSESSSVTIGCSEVNVNSISVVSPTELTINVSADVTAATLSCPVDVDGLDCGELTVTPVGDEECVLTGIVPAGKRARLLFPRAATLRITGNQNASFTRSSNIDLGTDDIRVLFSLAPTPQKIIAVVLIKARAATGVFPVTVDGCSGQTFEIR